MANSLVAGWQRKLAVASVAVVFTLLAGRWAQQLFTLSEFVHFSVNFPTLPGLETLPREKIGGPWQRIPEKEWKGYPPGGLLAWGREETITVDLGRQGALKRLFQPYDLTLSTHWLRNVGPTPRRIHLELDMCGLPVEWETFERFWDHGTHSSTRSIFPGALFNMDWHISVPGDRINQPMICAGELRVRDADTAQLLTVLPITVINSRAGGGP